MKKAISLTLALVMCLTLIPLALPMSASAYGSEWIHIERRTYIQGENMNIHVTGVTSKMVGDGAWVGIYKKGAAHGDVYDGAMRHFNDISDPDYQDFAWFNVPDEDGEYELRLYSKDDGDLSAANLTKYFLSSVTFFVGFNSGFSYGNQTIKIEKDNFDSNENMLIYFFGITQQMVDDEACCYICPKGSRDDIIIGCATMNQVGTYALTYFTAPVNPGDYEILLLSKWWQKGSINELLISSIPFTVGKVAKDGKIELDKTAYKAMDPIVVTYSGITEKMVNAKAFVRIHEKGAGYGHTSYGGAVVNLGNGTLIINAPNQNGDFEMRLYSVDDGNWNATGEFFVMSQPFSVSGASNTSGWAQEQQIAEKAAQYGLIPDKLKGADWTKPITRAEFAAVSVKLYESLTETKATPVAKNPFTDTNDAETLKAVGIGVTNGTSATLFSPNDLLNREQAATMLTRALKTAYIPGWTLDTDGNFTLNFTMPAKFTDDGKISDWAKPSVYFMVANKIINGVGDNMFAPKNTTDREIALGYANATREQALAIAVRMIENLKDKQVNFQQGAASSQPTAPTQPTTPPATPPTTPPVTPPGGNADAGLTGHWRHYYRVLFTGTGGASTYMNKYINYSFYEDGTFRYTSLIMYALVVEGKYSVSGGEIHFSDLNIYQINNNAARTIELKTPVNTSFSAKYTLGTDGNGQYLIIGVTDFTTNRTFDDFSTEDAAKQMSRKQTLDYANLDPYDEINHAEPVIMP